MSCTHPFAFPVISKCGECGRNLDLIGSEECGCWFVECSNTFCRLAGIPFAPPRLSLCLADDSTVERARAGHEVRMERNRQLLLDAIEADARPIRELLSELKK